MFRKTICAAGLIALLVSFLPNVHNCASAQETAATHRELKPLDPNDPRLTFSFPIQPGRKSLRFRVNLSRAGNIAGVSVFRDTDTKPIQTLPTCANVEISDRITKEWDDLDISELLEHADLNFDGYEDLKLVSNYNPRIYCIYMWNSKAERFLFSKELSDVSENLEVHPENKTLTTSAYWGTPWQESTYIWKDGKLELIEENSLFGDWSLQKDGVCGYTYACSRLVDGKMVTTLEKPVCTPEEMDDLPACPSAKTPPAPKAPDSKPATEKKD